MTLANVNLNVKLKTEKVGINLIRNSLLCLREGSCRSGKQLVYIVMGQFFPYLPGHFKQQQNLHELTIYGEKFKTYLKVLFMYGKKVLFL